jgi:hypothetical protein
MIITITNTEAQIILKDHFSSRLGRETTIIIESGWDAIRTNIIKTVEAVNPSDKIGRIRAFRSSVEKVDELKNAPGLADSKYAIENWEDFKHFIYTHNRLPINAGQSGLWSLNGFV